MRGSNRIEFCSTCRGTFLTLSRGNQITIDTESERQSDCTQIFAIHINKSYSTLEVYNNNVEIMNYSFSISILFLLQKDYMAQPLQTASSATDEQLISFTVTQEIRLQRRREREREKRAQKEQRRRRLEKRRECDRKKHEYENKRRQKHRELETFADKESRLLTRCVHRMKGETALQRERQLQIMREYQTERTNS